MLQNIEILSEYYNKYFSDLSAIDYIEIIPQDNLDILIQENTIGIPLKIIQLLYPICTEYLQNVEHQDMASWVILFLNGEHYTAWNIRQKLRNPKDLKLTQLICIKYPGASVAFNYRLSLESNYEIENHFFRLAYVRKNRSYHLWTYRLKYISKLNEQGIYEKEIEFMKRFASKDVHNYSIFHHMLICAQRCGAELYDWVIELKETYKMMYQGQEAIGEVDVKSLQSLNQFIKILS